MTLSVLIPTFRRPQGFLRAARSALAQPGVHEIIGLDNAPEHSARAVFAAFAREAGPRFIAGHERRAGVAFARNAALALAQGDLLAWLDDDEEAQSGWLAALERVQAHTGADVVFGPVRASAPAAPAAMRAYFERLYTRVGPNESGESVAAFGAGNSLMMRAALASPAPFDASANETGGEDDRLFAAMRAAGKRFAWAHDACVTEHVEAARLTLRHAMRRAFAYGQGPCELAWAAGNLPVLARHMCVGAAQTIVYGAASAVVIAGSTPHALALLDRAARGAGKVFWFCEQRFYGQALTRQLA